MVPCVSSYRSHFKVSEARIGVRALTGPRYGWVRAFPTDTHVLGCETRPRAAHGPRLIYDVVCEYMILEKI